MDVLDADTLPAAFNAFVPVGAGDRPDRVGVPYFFKGGVASSRESFFEGRSSVRGSPPKKKKKKKKKKGRGLLEGGGGFFLRRGWLLLEGGGSP